MKKFILISALGLFTILNVQAQIIQKLEKPERLSTKTLPVKSTPLPTSETRLAVNTKYYLTGIKVRTFTGNDNKEALSRFSFYLFRKGRDAYEIKANFNDNSIMPILSGNPLGYPEELKINTNAEFVLEPAYGAGDFMDLEKIQRYDLRLRISYVPNFFMDAWKIDKVAMTLEFKDANGNLHPTIGTKEITFFTPSILLNEGKTTVDCETDGFFIP